MGHERDRKRGLQGEDFLKHLAACVPPLYGLSQMGNVTRHSFEEKVAEGLLVHAVSSTYVSAFELADVARCEVRIEDSFRARTDGRVIYIPRRGTLRERHWLVAHELGHVLLARLGEFQIEHSADLIGLALLLPRDMVMRDAYALGPHPCRIAMKHRNCPVGRIAQRLRYLGFEAPLNARASLSGAGFARDRSA